MKAMNPTKIVDFKPEIPAYNIAKYQSTHPTGGCIMGTSPGTRSRTPTGRSGTRRTSSSPARRSSRRTPARTRPARSRAVTYRTADAIRDRYFKHPNTLLE